MALCAQSGSFAEDCRNHLWKFQAVRIADRHDGRDLRERFDSALVLHHRWEPRLGEYPGFDQRFWLWFYDVALRRQRPLDLGGCDTLPMDHQSSCVEAGVSLYAARVGRILENPQVQLTLCDPPPDGSLLQHAGETVEELRAKPYPVLERVLQEQLEFSCLSLP